MADDDDLIAGADRIGNNTLLRQVADVVQLERPHLGASREINWFHVDLRVGIAQLDIENDTFNRDTLILMVVP